MWWNAFGALSLIHILARAQQEEASLAFQQTLLNAGSEVNDALTAWQTSLSKSELLDKQVASLQTAYHIVRSVPLWHCLLLRLWS